MRVMAEEVDKLENDIGGNERRCGPKVHQVGGNQKWTCEGDGRGTPGQRDQETAEWLTSQQGNDEGASIGDGSARMSQPSVAMGRVWIQALVEGRIGPW